MIKINTHQAIIHILLLTSFVLNYFLLNRHFKYEFHFIIKILSEFLILFFIGIGYIPMKNNKILNFLQEIYKYMPFLEIFIFINTELTIYEMNGSLRWISFIRACTLSFYYQIYNRKFKIFLNKKENIDKFHQNQKKDKNGKNGENSKINIFLQIFIILIIIINFSFILEIQKIPFEILLLLIELSLFLYVFLLFSAKNLDFTALTNEPNELKLFHRINYFNFLYEGVIIIRKTKENPYNIEIFNEKSLNFIDYGTHVSKEILSFSSINEKFKGFSFEKMKNRQNEHTLNHIIIQQPEPFIDKNPPKPTYFDTLDEILSFYEKKSQNNETFYFKRLINNCYEDIAITHNLKMTINHEKYKENSYFFLLLKKTDMILDLKEKNEIKTRLLNSFSHELKTPLNGSIPMLEALNTNPKLDITLKSPYIDNTLGCLKLLDNTLNNILDYSLIISDQFIVNLCQIDVKELLKEVFSIVKHQIKLKGLELYIEIDASIYELYIYSDYNRMKQLLLNILLNAIQFTNKGNISVKLTNIFKKPLVLEFDIEDTGIGIEDIQLKKLTEKLKYGLDDFQLNSTGSCLGLTISNNIALILGKNPIYIESKIGKGSSFKFVVVDQKETQLFKDYEFVDISKKYLENSENIAYIKKSIYLRGKKEKNNTLLEFSRKFDIRRKNNLSAFKDSSRSFEELYKIHGPRSSISLKDKLETHNFEEMLKYAKISHFQDFPLQNPVVDEKRSEIDKKRDISRNDKKSTRIKFDFKLIENRDEKHILSDQIFSINSLGLYDSKASGTLNSLEYKNDSNSQFQSNFISILQQNVKETDISKQKTQNLIINQLAKKCDCESILIVDDDVFNLFSLEMILKGFGLKCSKAINGKEAIEILKKPKIHSNCQGYKLVIMDYQMPIMDGVESTKEIMNLIRNKEIDEVPVIGCTAFTTKNEVSRCLDAGMKDILFKPLSKNIIENLLNQWIL